MKEQGSLGTDQRFFVMEAHVRHLVGQAHTVVRKHGCQRTVAANHVILLPEIVVRVCFTRKR